MSESTSECNKSTRPLVQIVGIKDSFRGQDLLTYFQRTAFLVFSPVGVIVPIEDFSVEKFHSKYVSSILARRNISRGELGAALAHLNAAKRLLNYSKFPYSYVLEDDAKITQDLPFTTIDNFMKSEKPKILLLGWNKNTAVVNEKSRQENSKFVRLALPPTGSFAYVLNRSAAQIISSTSRENISLPDWPATAYLNIEFFMLEKMFAEAKNIESSIDLINLQDSSLRVTDKLSRSEVFLWVYRSIKLIFCQKSKLSPRQIFLTSIFRDFVFKFAKNVNEDEFSTIPGWLEWLTKFLTWNKKFND